MKPLTLINLIAFATIPLSIAYKGWVFSKLWLWFIVSTFGIPALGVAQSAGIILLICYATWHYRFEKEARDDDEKLERVVTALAASWAYPTTILIFGAIINQVR